MTLPLLLLLRHTGHCVPQQCGTVYRGGGGIKRSHHKPTVRSSLSIPWHCLANLGLGTIFIKCKCNLYSFNLFAISANHFCNWSGKSPQPLLATVRTKPHLWLMMYLGCFCFKRQRADGKAGARQTEQRGELLRLTLATPPSPHLPKLSAPPVTICEIWFSSFCKEREKHYTPLPPPPSLMALV